MVQFCEGTVGGNSTNFGGGQQVGEGRLGLKSEQVAEGGLRPQEEEKAHGKTRGEARNTGMIRVVGPRSAWGGVDGACAQGGNGEPLRGLCGHTAEAGVHLQAVLDHCRGRGSNLVKCTGVALVTKIT